MHNTRLEKPEKEHNSAYHSTQNAYFLVREFDL